MAILFNGMKIDIKGVGAIGAPTPMGRFIGDCMQQLVNPLTDRVKAKRWLAQELMARLTAAPDFPAEERRKLCHAMLEEFRIPTGEQDAAKRWFVSRVRSLATEFERIARNESKANAGAGSWAIGVVD